MMELLIIDDELDRAVEVYLEFHEGMEILLMLIDQTLSTEILKRRIYHKILNVHFRENIRLTSESGGV